ncbi:O-antigen ligase family protein [Vibrio parahaemolyticus]
MKFFLCNIFFFSLFFRGILPSKTFEVIVILMFILGMVDSLIKKNSKIDLQTFGLILFVIISALFQVYFTQHLSLLANHIIYLFQGVLVFYSVRYICRLSSTEYALKTLIAWASVVATIGVLFYIANIYSYSPIFDQVIYQKGGMARLTGFQTNPNYFSLTVCIIPLLCVVLPNFKYKKFCIIIVIIAVLFSGSRGGILASLVPLILYLYLNSKHKIFYGFTITIILFSMLVLINSDLIPMLSRFDTSNSNFSSGRTDHWIKAIELFSENYLYGVGNNSFLLYETENGNPIQVHNNYLRLLAEGGVIYFLSWGVFISLLGVNNNSKREYYFLILPLLIFSLVNDPYISKEFWLYLSIALLVGEHLRKKSEQI